MSERTAAWLVALVLVPLGLFLAYRATTGTEVVGRVVLIDGCDRRTCTVTAELPDGRRTRAVLGRGAEIGDEAKLLIDEATGDVKNSVSRGQTWFQSSLAFAVAAGFVLYERRKRTRSAGRGAQRGVGGVGRSSKNP